MKEEGRTKDYTKEEEREEDKSKEEARMKILQRAKRMSKGPENYGIEWEGGRISREIYCTSTLKGGR